MSKKVLVSMSSASMVPDEVPERLVPVHYPEAEKQVEAEVEQKVTEKCLRPVTCPPQPQPQRSWEG